MIDVNRFKDYAETHKPPNVDEILEVVTAIKKLIGRKSTMKEKELARSIYVIWKNLYDNYNK